jgi:hypothetical protein
VRGITLTAQFTKAFLRMLEHPPDAHRGFDVPAAVVTVGDIPSASSMAVYNTTDSRRRRSTSSSGGSDSKGSSSSNGGSDSKGSSSERAWWVIVAPGAPAADELQQVTPLMVQLNLQRPPLVSIALCDCSTDCSALAGTAWEERPNVTAVQTAVHLRYGLGQQIVQL